LSRSTLPLVLISALLAAAAPADSSEPPNFLVVVFDDLGYGDVGAYGSSFIQTPNMDALAAEGARFTRFYANAPSCSPNRAALLTGRHPVNVGIRTNVVASSLRGLPLEVPTLAELLKGAGYTTGLFGKWHLGLSRPEDGPAARGFDRSAVRLRSGPNAGDMLVDGVQTVSVLDRDDFATDLAIEFMEAYASEPFFLKVWYSAPHGPWTPPPEWAAQYPPTLEGLYAAEVSAADERLGRLLDSIEGLGLDQQTVVLVMSDNGAKEKELPSPLRGWKWGLYEGGIRVPLLVRWPGQVAAGDVLDEVAAAFDIAPTLMELAGATAPSRGFDGRSLAGVLSGSEPGAPRAIVWEYSTGQKPEPAPPEDSSSWAVMEGDWKLLRQAAESPPALYDLGADPAETTDLAAANPDVVARLTGEYASWRQTAGEVSVGFDRVEGAAVENAGWYEFVDGAAVLEAHSGLRVDDGDLSFRARIWPERTVPRQTIAEQPGSWSLKLVGRRLQLETFDGDGARVLMGGFGNLTRDTGASVAFTLFGVRGRSSQLRLYLDGVLQGEFELDGLALSDEPVRLGRDLDGLFPFEGTLWAPSFRRLALLPSELADRDGDGVLDSDDACIDVPDAPLSPGGAQLDADGDGLGDACDADFDGSGLVSLPDLLRLTGAYQSAFGDPTYDSIVDLDHNGLIGTSDLLRVLHAYGQPPGPSGSACDGTLLCYGP